MEGMALILLLILSITGFILIFLSGIGTLLILIGAVIYAFATQFEVVGIKTLLAVLTLYLMGEVMEYVCVIIGAKKVGASNVAAVGAIIGGVLGAIIGLGGFGIGLFPGALLGIFLGAFVAEYFVQRDLVKSLKAGLGSVLGRLGSMLVKIVIAIMMLGILAIKIIPSLNNMK